MDNERQLKQRMSFLAVVIWISLCLICAGWVTRLDPTLRKIWATAGLIGIASAVGLAVSVKSEMQSQKDLIESYMGFAGLVILWPDNRRRGCGGWARVLRVEPRLAGECNVGRSRVDADTSGSAQKVTATHGPDSSPRNLR